MPRPIDKDRQLADILIAAEAFRAAMIESGAVHKVSQDQYEEQLRALERTLQPLNYLIPPEMLPFALEPDIAVIVTMLCERQDCSIKIQRGEETTMGWLGRTYDRQGKRTDGGNPNRADFAARCERCSKSWAVRTKGERVVDIR